MFLYEITSMLNSHHQKCDHVIINVNIVVGGIIVKNILHTINFLYYSNSTVHGMFIFLFSEYGNFFKVLNPD